MKKLLPIVLLWSIATMAYSNSVDSVKADFTYEVVCGTDSVRFTDASQGDSIIYRSWSFGDSTTSTQQNPVHLYSSSGAYQVRLTIAAANGDTAIKEVYLSTISSLLANFSTSVLFPGQVRFTDKSTSNHGNNYSRSWDFGDGSNSTDANPFHYFPSTDTFNVCLKIAIHGCADSICKEVGMQVPNSSGSFCHSFEDSTFTNWLGYTGMNDLCCATLGLVTDRHTITSTGLDTCTGITAVAPGQTHSARLGNILVGREAERLYYSFTPTLVDTAFTYQYAVVLNKALNIAHTGSDVASFEAIMFDTNGDTIPGTHTLITENDTSLSMLDTNAACYDLGNGRVVYNDWRTVKVNLAAYIGQTVNLRFSTSDCNFGSHFGYAYVDVDCNETSNTVEEMIEPNMIEVFPNPSRTGLFTVRNNLSTDGLLNVYTMMGEKIMEVPVPELRENLQLDLSSFATGHYLLVLNSKSELYSKKVLYKR